MLVHSEDDGLSRLCVDGNEEESRVLSRRAHNSRSPHTKSFGC